MSVSGYKCRGTCEVGRTKDGVQFRCVVHRTGRLPNDPATGERPPRGTYGSWKRCRVCDILIIWDGTHCPCCGTVLKTRPRYTQIPWENNARGAEESFKNLDGSPGRPCEICGKAIPRIHGRPVRFCSDPCRHKHRKDYWERNKDRILGAERAERLYVRTVINGKAPLP